MSDKLSAIWDLVIVIVFVCVRAAAICYGSIGVVTHQTEFIATSILLYLVSNTWEKIMDEKFKNVGKIEPITKNDLGVREFEEIVVEYPPEDLCPYPEYKGKPYFSIKFKEGNDCFIGFGTYNPKVFSRYLRDYFMTSVTSQEPVLDKYKAESEG